MTRLYVSLGRESGLRPQDLVGAITGETSLNGRNIGAIEISGRSPSSTCQKVPPTR